MPPATMPCAGPPAAAWAGTFPEKDTSPAIPPQAFGDYNTAIMMAAGLLGALVNKLRTGQGDKVVVNLYHSAIWGGSIGLCAQQFGADYPKSRTDVPNPFNNTYKTADDKWLYICQPQHNRYYNDMMKLIGRDDLVDDPRYATIENVKANHLQPELITILDEGFSKKDLEEWLKILAEWDVPSQKVFRFTDILKDDEAYVNDAIRKVKYNAFGEHALPTTPIRFGGYGDPPIILSKPIGYHTAEYLEQYGYTPEQIAELEEKGAVKCYHGEEVPDTIFKSERRRRARPPATGRPSPRQTRFLSREGAPHREGLLLLLLTPPSFCVSPPPLAPHFPIFRSNSFTFIYSTFLVEALDHLPLGKHIFPAASSSRRRRRANRTARESLSQNCSEASLQDADGNFALASQISPKFLRASGPTARNAASHGSIA